MGLRSRRTDHGPEHVPMAEHLLALVLVRLPATIGPESLLAAWHSAWPGIEAPTDIRVVDGTYQAMEMRIGSVTAHVGIAPTPLPEADVARGLRRSSLWHPDRDDPRSADGQVVALVTGHNAIVDGHLHLTRLVTAILHAVPAVGVYWAGAGHLVEPELFDGLAHLATTEHLPVQLWLATPVQTDAGRHTLITHGLRAFGVMEVELTPSLREPGELREWTWELARNLITRRPLLRDGDTVGRDDHERILVRITTSTTGRPERVLLLEGL